MTLVITAALMGLPSVARGDSGGQAPVRGNVDMQGHLTMHIPMRPVYSPGPLGALPKKPLTEKHTLRQVMYEPYLRRSGVTIFATAAMSAEFGTSRKQARKLILKQFKFVEEFVAANPDRYALAKTPAQARKAIAEGKQVFIHSIEGGRKLLGSPEDARFWADQGVALMTLIHLWDDENGGADLALVPWFNPEALFKRWFHRNQKRGLTDRGRQAVVDLARAGITVDITHMSPESVRDTLEITRSIGAAPVATHSRIDAISHGERSLSDEQILDIYRQGGMYGIATAPEALNPHEPSIEIPADTCESSHDVFEISYRYLDRLLKDSDLPESRKVFGWSSDWNGMTSHLRPKYGKRGCLAASKIDGPAMEIDTQGLAHPGILPQLWARLEQRGLNLEVLDRSAERFLQIWENALKRGRELSER